MKISSFLKSAPFKLALLAAPIFAILPSNAWAMGSDPKTQPQTVDHVDLDRYIGRWYEIARFEQKFQKGCVGVTADYSIRDDGKIGVLNTCIADTLDGEVSTAEGYAYVKDEETNAKLRVTFFWPFFGDYWIFELADDYSYAVVGSPDRDSLWFLSRTPQISEILFQDLSARMTAKGFDMTRLQRTLQKAK